MSDSPQSRASASSPRTDLAPAVAGQVLAGVDEAVLIADASGQLRYANPAAVRLHGWQDAGEAPASLHDFEPPFELRRPDGEPLAFGEWPIARAAAGERFGEVDCLLRGQDGRERLVRCSGGPVDLDDGKPGGWVVLRDVGREETILHDLREQRDLSGALVELSPLAIAVLRAPGMVFELVNQVFDELRPGSEKLGRSVLEVFPEAGAAGFVGMLEEVAASGETASRVDAPIDFLGPSVRYFSFTFSRLPQPPGRPTRLLVMGRETTQEVLARNRAEAIAAERTRDLARARTTSARLRSLVDLAAAMASVEDLDSLLYLVSGEATRLLRADTASLFLLDERGDAMTGRAVVGLPSDEVVGMHIELASWPELAELLRGGRTVVHHRAEEVQGPERPFVDRYRIKSYLAVRLGTPGRPLGVMFVNHVHRRHRFTQAELAFVETLSSYVSAAIERARLVGNLREAVMSLQDGLLPATFPEITGVEVGALYRSASEVAQVGGDFYDLFPLADGLVAAVVGDVCGKGAAAARHTVRLRYELRTLLEADADPGRALRAFNALVFKEVAADEYATLLVLVLDPASGAVRWASAGHPAPVIAGARSRQAAFKGSLPVGLFPKAGYANARFTLKDGQAVVLYTDGVVEARSQDGDQFGVERLLAAVPPPGDHPTRVAETILDAVLRHTHGHLDDDAALLVLYRRGSRRGPVRLASSGAWSRAGARR